MVTTMRSPVVLTDRNLSVLDYIRSESIRCGLVPSLRQIGAHFNIRSPNGVLVHIERLIAAGKIRRVSLRNHRFELVADPGCCAACQRPMEV